MKSYYIAKVLFKLRISSFKNCHIDKKAKVDAQCTLAYVDIDRFSYVGSKTQMTSTRIGAFSSIGNSCQIGGGEHPLDYVSTSPVFLNGRNILRKNFANIPYDGTKKVSIGNDVFVGDGCYIKAGVTIGDGAVIGAHAVVTQDVEPYTIVAGVPARAIRKRFDDETVDDLLKISWWNWPDEKIEKFADLFGNPKDLIAAVKGEV